MAASYVTNFEVRRWKSSVEGGASIRSVARTSGRSLVTVYHHTRDPVAILKRRAERLERLFASCNRALGIEGPFRTPKAPDVARMRELDAQGLPFRAIARLVGVDARTVRRALGRSRTEALRVEELFSSCNRVLAEVRA